MVQIGYYPGQPIPRPPKGKPIPPNEYNFDAVNQWVNQLDYDVSGLPEGVKDQVVGEFKRTLTASATPTKATYDKNRALMFGDLEESPGLQLKLNLNPLDWVNDPGKQFEKTFQNWKESFTSRTDFNNWVERRYFWEPLLSGRDELTPVEQQETLPSVLEPAEKIAKKLTSEVEGQEKFGKNPFHLTGFDVKQEAPWLTRRYVTPTIKKDSEGRTTVEYEGEAGSGRQNVYQATAEKFLDFVDNAEAAAKRNQAYNSLAFEAANAVKTELENRFGLRDGLDVLKEQVQGGHEADTTLYKFLDTPDNLAKFQIKVKPDEGPITIKDFVSGFKFGDGIDQLNSSSAAALADYITGHTVANSMRFFGAGPTGDAGIAGLTKNLSAISLEGNMAVDAVNRTLSLQEVLDKARKSIVTDEINRLENVEEWLKSLAEDPKAGKEFKDKINGILKSYQNDSVVKRYKEKISSLETLLDGAIAEAGKIKSQDSSAAKALIRKLNPQLKDFQASVQDSGFFGKGLYHEQVNRLAATITDKRAMFGKAEDMEELFGKAVEYGRKTGRGTGIINTRNILDLGKRNFDRNDVKDFLTNVEDGRLFTAYVLPKIRERFNYTQPVERFLKKRHYFGLIYDPGEMESNIRTGIPLSKNNPLFNVRLDDHGNLVVVGSNLDAYAGLDRTIGGNYRYLLGEEGDLSARDVFSRWMPKNTFSLVGVNGQKFAVEGGRHFLGAVSINKVLTATSGSDPTKGGLKALLDKKGHFDRFEKPEDALDLIKLLNGQKTETYRLPNVVKKPEDVARHLAQFGLFREWLYKHRHELGLVFDDSTHMLVMEGAALEKNAEVLSSLFKQLSRRIASNDYISIFWERAGYLQKLVSWGSQVRTWGMRQIAPFTAPYIQLRNALVNSITLGISTFLKGLVGAGTVGIGAAIVKFIDPAVRFIVNAVAVKAEAFLTAIIKGEYGKFAAQMEKLINNSVKYALYIVAIPMLIILSFSLLFFGTSFSSIAQVDWTRTAGGGVGDQGGYIPGTTPPPPAGNFGTGENCPAVYPVPQWTNYYCFHWDGLRPVDIYGAKDQTIDIVAPFAGTTYSYDDPTGGASIILFPDDPSGDIKDDITSDCPSLYFTHLTPGGRVTGHVNQGDRIAFMGDTGNAAGKKHLHFAASTMGVFMYGWQIDVCSVQLFESSNPCNRELHSGKSQYPGDPWPLCCNSEFTDRTELQGNGCTPAVNQ